MYRQGAYQLQAWAQVAARRAAGQQIAPATDAGALLAPFGRGLGPGVLGGAQYGWTRHLAHKAALGGATGQVWRVMWRAARRCCAATGAARHPLRASLRQPAHPARAAHHVPAAPTPNTAGSAPAAGAGAEQPGAALVQQRPKEWATNGWGGAGRCAGGRRVHTWPTPHCCLRPTLRAPCAAPHVGPAPRASIRRWCMRRSAPGMTTCRLRRTPVLMRTPLPPLLGLPAPRLPELLPQRLQGARRRRRQARR